MKAAYTILLLIAVTSLVAQMTNLTSYPANAPSNIGTWINQWETAGHEPTPRELPEPNPAYRIVVTEFPIITSNDTLLAYASVGDSLFDNANYFYALFVNDDPFHVYPHHHLDVPDTTLIEVYLPAGVYYTTNQIELNSNTILRGESAATTRIELEGRAAPDYTIENDLKALALCVVKSVGCSNVGVEDLTVKRLDLQDQYNFGGNPNLFAYWESYAQAHDFSTDLANYEYNLFGYMMSGSRGSNIAFSRNANCWVTGVVSENSLRHNISLNECLHCEVRGCYLNDPQNIGEAGAGYGVLVHTFPNTTSITSEYNLVENNIMRRCRHSMIYSGDVRYNVFGYNYSREPHGWVKALFGGLKYWDHMIDMCCHGRGVNRNLFEGNHGQLMGADNSQNYAGGQNGIYNTYFRSAGKKYGMQVDVGQSNQVFIYTYHRCTSWTWCQLHKIVESIFNGYLDIWSALLNQMGIPGSIPHIDISAPEMLNCDVYRKHVYRKWRKFWGGYSEDVKNRDTYGAGLDQTYYLDPNNLPDFYNPPVFQEMWPYEPKGGEIPAYYRYNFGVEKTVSRYDTLGFVIQHHWTGVDTIETSFTIGYTEVLLIDPGATIYVNPDVEITILGGIDARGEADSPITITAADTTQGWKGFRFGAEYKQIGVFVFPNTDHDYGLSLISFCNFRHCVGEPETLAGNKLTQSASGSAISAYHYDNLELSNCTFVNCNAMQGGAIYLEKSDAVIEQCKFESCEATYSGGAIHVRNSSPQLWNNEIQNCSALSATGEPIWGFVPGGGGGLRYRQRRWPHHHVRQRHHRLRDRRERRRVEAGRV